MLIGIDPRITPDLLCLLARQGHGDEIVVADRNFPAYSQPGVPVAEMPGVSSSEMMRILLGLVPLDTFVPETIFRMEVVGDPARLEPVQSEVEDHLRARHGGDFSLHGIERFAFYDRAARAQLIIRTGELRFYGCFILTVGALPPEETERFLPG